ncbi:siderophore-interacting protein [Microbacterium sp. ZW T5_56]|uniref:siderophore-interacting protein n=1 Tax=Microbacterium sp. ZW T5_56 TaxID=3378081 RepID=UPI0038539E42
MSVETTTEATPFVVIRAEVRRVQRVSPNFVRVTFGGDALDDFATPGAVFDLRIKLIFPPASGVLPEFDGRDGWYQGWLAIDEAERGSMRTYSIRDLRVTDAGTEMDIDFVLHLAPGLTGPASSWANQASEGDELIIAGPRRGHDWGGIEYAPGDATSVLLAGDETAAPAIARVLEDAPADLRGIAFIEVSDAADALEIAAPAGVQVRWLPRGDAPHGTLLLHTVLEHLGAAPAAEVRDVETESTVWETPTFSGLGEELDSTAPHADRYFWIAGESGVVTTLRRHLVKDVGIDRTQVAFMGYWRRGVAMKG